jgi:hypothetical protein
MAGWQMKDAQPSCEPQVCNVQAGFEGSPSA